MGNTLYRNLPNFVSILGVLPIGLLLLPDGHRFLIPLIIYNNIMDDLDGILAARLNLRSSFGAMLDNVCDTVTHTLFVLAVGMHFGGLCAVAAGWAMVGLILRVVSRLESPPVIPRGSPTNELVRHLLFVLLLAGSFEFPASTVLMSVFVIHGVAMLAPFEMPHMIRSRARSAVAIGGVNLALVTAWLIPATTAPIAAAFGLTFLYSFGAGLMRWRKRAPAEERRVGISEAADMSAPSRPLTTSATVLPANAEWQFRSAEPPTGRPAQSP